MVVEIVPLLGAIGTILGFITRKWVIALIGIILLLFTLGGTSMFTGIPLWILLLGGFFIVLIIFKFKKK